MTQQTEQELGRRRLRHTVYVPGAEDPYDRYVTYRMAWMDRQSEELPVGSRITYYKGEGFGTHQYLLRADRNWTLERVTYAGGPA